jgi:hypothetical protein
MTSFLVGFPRVHSHSVCTCDLGIRFPVARRSCYCLRSTLASGGHRAG